MYDKSGLVELAGALHAAGVEIVSTGSTARTVADAGIPVTPVESVTGFPECLDGRVKTLHPGIHAGLLADTRKESHTRQLAELGIAPFELVVVNLYPFRETVASGASIDECIEQIDIGGPAMIRASAKNHAVGRRRGRRRPGTRTVAGALQAGGFTARGAGRAGGDARSRTPRATTSLSRRGCDRRGPPATAGRPGPARRYEQGLALRYGENPHQDAALYRIGPARAGHPRRSCTARR